MKLRELIANIDIPKELDYTDYDDIAEFVFEGRSLHCSDYDKWSSRAGSVHLASWTCTDTRVGLEVHFIDRKPVLLSWQPARKSDIEFSVIDPELLAELREHVLACCDEPEPTELEVADLDQEMNEGYTVSYGSQLYLGRELIHQKRKAVVVGINRDHQDIDKWHLVDIKFSDDDSQATIDLKEAIFPYEHQLSPVG